MARPSGSPAEVGRLYADHARRVSRWVTRFYARDDAEEVVHEIFVKVLERLDTFRNDASPTTWLYRMTVNHCLNRLRNEGRRAELWRQLGDTPWMVSTSPAEQDTMMFLSQFWRLLPDELVVVGIHYFVDGLTHAEVARILGCSARTVGNRVDRLRALATNAAELPQSAKVMGS